MEVELFDPKNKNYFLYNWYRDKNFNFDSFKSIPDFFVEDENNLTNIQSDFYNEVKFPNYDNIDDFGTLIDKASKSIFAKKIDEELPNNSKILEAGCGTGQFSIFLSRYNREIYSIDLSKGSLLMAKNFIDNSSIENVFLSRMNIFNLFFKNDFFDFIISNGVLHHTHNPKKAFYELTKRLKKNGYISIGLYHKNGRFFHSIRQKIISNLGDRFKFLDTFFSKNVSDSKKYAWYLDQYKNPLESSHTLKEILTWFEEYNIDYISSIPFDFQVDEEIFLKRKKPNKLKLFFKEFKETFNFKNLEEGGFFIIIGRKK